MIYRNSDIARTIEWQPDGNQKAGDIARQFLTGESELLELASARTSAVVALTRFLENSAGFPLQVERAGTGELLVKADLVDEQLLVTGKTANVLAGYLDEELVLMQDRLDMTVRQRIAW